MRAPVLDQLSALTDETRVRLLLTLETHELTVGELCRVLSLPQSTVSRHLRLLGEQRWVAHRREGTRRFYRLELPADDPVQRRLWQLVKDSLLDRDQVREDHRRLQVVLEERREQSQNFFASAAEQWEHVRTQMYGTRSDLLGLLGFLDHRWTVGDLGCGTGMTAVAIAGFVDRVIAVDNSAAMLHAAQEHVREAGVTNVELRSGRLEELPLDDQSLDAALLFLVLHHCVDPPRVLRECARVLKPGAVLVLVDMAAHDRDELRDEMGHVWLGFTPETIEGVVAASGFEGVRSTLMPRENAATGPPLFLTRAARAAAAGLRAVDTVRTAETGDGSRPNMVQPTTANQH